MNALRILAIGLVIVAGIGVSTATIAAPVHTAQPLILPADPPKTKTPEAGKTSDDKTGDERVAQSIAKFFGVPVADVLTLHNSGKGYGEIVKAYALAQGSGKSVNDIFASRANEQGWGEIVKSLAVAKWNASVGKVVRNAAADKNPVPAGDAPGKSGEHRNDKGNKDKAGDKGKDD